MPPNFDAHFADRVTADLDAPAREMLRARLRQHTTDRYAGIPLSKFPEDLRVYEQLLWMTRANTVIEIGTASGGSALWFRDRLRALERYGRTNGPVSVISVDLDHEAARGYLAAADPAWEDSITLITGDVREPETAARVAALLGDDSWCLLIEDAAHEHDTTTAALEHFSVFVPPGGFLVVEDGVVDEESLRIDGWPRGVLPALREWLKTPAGEHFEVRRELERYGTTCHPEGFLQRVRPEVSATLHAEVSDGGVWMYGWEITPDLRAYTGETLAGVHRTRARMLLPCVADALREAGPAPRVIDLGCNEGWFSHLMLEHGAAYALGIDIREENIRRAKLMRRHMGIAPAELELRLGSVLDLDPAELGTFDIVLVLGLIYHLEDPGGALRMARALSRPGGLVAVETQLTRQQAPIQHGWGVPDVVHDALPSFAGRMEDDEAGLLASSGHVLSLIPNRAATAALLIAAGFEDVRWLEAEPGDEPQYVCGDRGMAVARAPRPD
ncbi:MAG: hypothetical protein NVSMB51_12720 [Solirubrobacteraceae bacterium]